MSSNPTARILHDVGLAAWFGGSLMGAAGLNGAAAEVKDPTDRARVASAGWARWAPLNAVAVGAHVTGAALIVRRDRYRIGGQAGVASWSTAKTALTAAALGVTAYSGLQGRKVQTAGTVPAAGGTKPVDATPPETAATMRRLRATQWAIPALTGSLVAVSAVMGEQQRPGQVLRGAAHRAARTGRHLATHPAQAGQLAGAAVRARR